ncbi:NAD(P)H-dependent oxidoreductase [Enterococcus rivorum]|uniref:NAD(P)H dehydrogenase n=1 Tax=Enterococcus rivorum TaxID=762845 RepID=A0A1E5KYH7_9ENTE|nr:NAD(P)H-dependent oxidoreductase [Enterococcus rivorum]MBP2097482.1 putative NADPH-quinone reductase [Enterococcus rivorum]OEH82942.1 NAD(P)H dehydrogenase [Enterococcus rivorum]
MKQTTIILAHPWHGSFNKRILDETIRNLERKKQKYQLIDLNKDQFNPVLKEEELALFAKGEHLDPLVSKYQKLLKESDSLIFIFPIWWADIPAILKGFLDKVMLKQFAYTTGKFGLEGRLTHIKKATVITTSDSPKWYLRYFAGNSIRGVFINSTLKGIGIKNVRWYHCNHIKKEGLPQRKKFLEVIKQASFQ